MPTRLYCLDVARGLAAFSVILWHWQHFFYSAPGTLSAEFQRESQPLYEVLYPFYNHGGRYAVSFFFILSGFIFFWLYGDKIKLRIFSLKSFCLARFSRLYPLHFLSLLIVLALQSLYKEEYQDYFVYPFNDSFHFGLNLIFGSHWGFEKGLSFNAPIWSVSVEIGLYAVFFLVVATKRSSWIYLVAFIVILFLSRRFGLSIRWQGPLATFFLGGLTFYGLQFYLNNDWRSRFTDLLLITFPIAGWVLLAVSNSIIVVALTRYSLLIPIVFPSTIFGLVLFELVVNVPFSKVKWIGDCTYSSYLLHFPLQLLFALAVPHYFPEVEEAFYSTWMLLLFILLLIPLSLISFNFFEVPLQNYTRQVGKRLLKIEQVGADNGDKCRA